MTSVADDYAAIAGRLRALHGGRTGTAMPARALHRPVTDPGTIPSDAGTEGRKAPSDQPKPAGGNADPDWPWCFWLSPTLPFRC